MSKLDSRGPKSTAVAAAAVVMVVMVGVATFSHSISEDGKTFKPGGRGAEHKRVLSVLKWR